MGETSFNRDIYCGEGKFDVVLFGVIILVGLVNIKMERKCSFKPPQTNDDGEDNYMGFRSDESSNTEVHYESCNMTSLSWHNPYTTSFEVCVVTRQD